MRLRRLTTSTMLAAVGLLLVTVPTAAAAPQTRAGSGSVPAVDHALKAPDVPLIGDLTDCTSAPTPEVPGRGVVGFFQSPPKTPPPAGDPFVKDPTTSIYEQYGYAGLRFNTYDLGCGPDLARQPDAAIGTAIANWIIALPKAAVAATGAVLDAAFAPDFLGVFDPLIDNVVQTLRQTVFEKWAFVVVGALGVLLIWRSRQASLASAAGAIGWALLVMVLVTMVFRWPLVAGHAADETVTSTLGAVTGGLNDKAPGAASDAGTEATAGMQEALLYQSWLGGTFGDANSEVAKKYGPVIFDATALTWAQAETLRTDPDAGKAIIEAKQEKFEAAAAKIKDADPDAYDYLTGKRSDTRVGYALLAGLATLCAVPFLFVAGLLVLGALIIVRFGVMLFPAFATLGLFPTMRTLVTGIGSTVVAALINALVFGIGAGVTVLGLGVLLDPASGTPPWLDVILMLLLTIIMWVALRPFRRLTMMISSRTNHFAAASSGVSTTARSAARTSGRILTTALGTFLGVSAAARAGANAAPVQAQTTGSDGVPQRAEAETAYQEPATLAPAPGTQVAGGAPAGAGPAWPVPVGARGRGPGQPTGQSAAMAGSTGALQVNAGSVTVIGPGGGVTPAEAADEIYAPALSSRIEAGTAAGLASNVGRVVGAGHLVARSLAGPGEHTEHGRPAVGSPTEGGRYEFASTPGYVPRRTDREYVGPVLPAGQDPEWNPATDGEPSRRPSDQGFARPQGRRDEFDLDELGEVFRPDPARQR